MPNPSSAAPILGQGLTMGQLLRLGQLCCGGGQAGDWWHRCTGAVRVPGLPAVVAELGATALTPTGEAGTFGTAVGKDSIAVGRRRLELGYSRVPPPGTARPGCGSPSPALSWSHSPSSGEPGYTLTSPPCPAPTALGLTNYLAQPGAPALADRAAQALQSDQDWTLPWARPAQHRTK